MRLAYYPLTLHFKSPAGTSRGVMRIKQTYLLKLWDETAPERYGVGEAAVFDGLSKEADGRYEYKLVELLANIALGRSTDLTDWPSIRFGLEQAIRDFSTGGRGLYYPSPFTEGKSEIEINGLVWMGDIDTMMARLEEKIESGFHCIKLKIGALDFRQEMRMLEAIRSRFDAAALEIRVDANGAFTMDNALPALHILSGYEVHSIEQPIKAGQWEMMRFLCDVSRVPIALDEELIGLNRREQKIAMLDTIHPAWIVLKPALCGGFSGAEEWIALAEERGIGWWVTSALECNVGLSALAQWTATLGVKMPQGLGTGQLYTDNFPSPLILDGDRLRFNPAAMGGDRKALNNLDWRE
ncbi:MAG: o-succinylbenzoate synthase [Muribaculaceae bacterium]|nr:o-succinylbenzoate synthase [Muribaculaceae bacterium]